MLRSLMHDQKSYCSLGVLIYRGFTFVFSSHCKLLDLIEQTIDQLCLTVTQYTDPVISIYVLNWSVSRGGGST